jgi:outer membrane protein assembly factor BamD
MEFLRLLNQLRVALMSSPLSLGLFCGPSQRLTSLSDRPESFSRGIRSVAICAFLLLGATGCATSFDSFDTSTPEGAFNQAEALEKDERFDEAIQKFAEIKNKYPYSRLAVLSELKIADLHFQRQAYIEAQAAYQLFKEFHPKYSDSDYVTYRLGMSYFNQLPETADRDLSVAEKAIAQFDELLSNYPKSKYAKEATEKRNGVVKMLAEKELYIADFYARTKKCDSALKRYETVLAKYPNQGLAAKALYGAAKCSFEIGEKERGNQHLKNLTKLYPSTEEAKRAKQESMK